MVLGPTRGAVGGVDVRGGGPGTRETDLLDPRALVEQVDAVVLTGGSAYGLAAADGVMAALEAAGVGFPVGPEPGQVVPIVPAAVIFDLGRGGDFGHRPTAEFGARALAAASGRATRRPAASAPGPGPTCGGLKGGFGYAELRLGAGVTVAAAVVVNAAGSPVDPATGRLWADRRAAGCATPTDAERHALAAAYARGRRRRWTPPSGVLLTDATLTKAQAGKVAAVGHDGLARAIRPVHSMLDGDTVFCLASGRRPPPADPLAAAGRTSTGCWPRRPTSFADACLDALLAAEGAGTWRAYRELAPTPSRLRNRPGARRRASYTVGRHRTTTSDEDAMKALLLENIHPEGVRLLTERGIEVRVGRGCAGRGRAGRRAGRGRSCSASGPRPPSPPRCSRRAPDLLAVGAFCIGTNQIDLAAAAERGHRGVQRAVLQHPQRGRAGDRRDHLAGPAPDRQERGHARRRLGQVGQGCPRGPRPDPGHRRLRQHRQPAVGGRRVARHAGATSTTWPTSWPWATPAAATAWTSCWPRPRRSPCTSTAGPGNAGLFGEPSSSPRCGRAACSSTCAAGIVVDHEALREHLLSGHIAGAAVDVFAEEPKTAGDPFVSSLQGLPNVILTPHIGGSTEEAQEDIGRFVAGKLRDFAGGGTTIMSVNLPQVQTEPRRPDPDPARAPQRAGGAGHGQRGAGRLPGQHRGPGAVHPRRAGLRDHRRRRPPRRGRWWTSCASLPETVRLRVIAGLTVVSSELGRRAASSARQPGWAAGVGRQLRRRVHQPTSVSSAGAATRGSAPAGAVGHEGHRRPGAPPRLGDEVLRLQVGQRHAGQIQAGLLEHLPPRRSPRAPAGCRRDRPRRVRRPGRCVPGAYAAAGPAYAQQPAPVPVQQHADGDGERPRRAPVSGRTPDDLARDRSSRRQRQPTQQPASTAVQHRPGTSVAEHLQRAGWVGGRLGGG